MSYSIDYMEYRNGTLKYTFSCSGERPTCYYNYTTLCYQSEQGNVQTVTCSAWPQGSATHSGSLQLPAKSGFYRFWLTINGNPCSGKYGIYLGELTPIYYKWQKVGKNSFWKLTISVSKRMPPDLIWIQHGRIQIPITAVPIKGTVSFYCASKETLGCSEQLNRYGFSMPIEQ